MTLYCSTPLSFQLTLSKREVELLPLAICARFCQTLVFGHHHVTQDPSNHYVMADVTRSTQHLLRLWSRPRDAIINGWKDVMAGWGVAYPD